MKNIKEIVEKLKAYYEERYNEAAPYYDSNECHLVLRDGTSIVGLVGVRYGLIEVEWSDPLYNVLMRAREYFSTHSTDWGVYYTQV